MLPNGSNVASEKGREGLPFSLAMSKLYTYKVHTIGQRIWHELWVLLVNILSAHYSSHCLSINKFCTL
jgi:hypothetical protein